MKNRNRNAGLATMEIIVAAVILAVVIIGVVVVIKFVSGGQGDSTKQSAQQHSESVYDMLKTCAANADLDIAFATQSNVCTLRLVGRNSCHLFRYNSTSKTLFYQEKQYTNASTDEEKISAARSMLLDEASATRLCNGAQVVTFFAMVPDLSQEGAVVTVQLRVEDSEDSYYKEYQVPACANLIAYKNGTYVPPTETPAEPDVSPEATETPSAPTNTPTPTTSLQSSKVVGTTSFSSTYEQMVEYLEDYGEDATLVLTLRFRTGSAKQSWGVGGLAIDSDSCEGDVFEYFIDHDPEVNETFIATYELKDIVSVMEDREASEIKTVFYNGFTMTKAEILYD